MQTLIFINTPVDSALEEKIRLAAAKIRVSRAEFMRRAASEYLKRDEFKPKEKGGSNATTKQFEPQRA
jgi:hypothetical protein